jgi:glycine cleavage system H protein
MGEVWHVSVPKLGTITSDETPLFIIETAKSAIEFCLPFQANIIAVNDELMAQPALINQSPFEEGWVVEIATHRPLKFESLLSEQAYLRLLDG